MESAIGFCILAALVKPPDQESWLTYDTFALAVLTAGNLARRLRFRLSGGNSGYVTGMNDLAIHSGDGNPILGVRL